MTIIRVDRSVRPVYFDCMKRVMHPELEATGPAEYDLATVQLWLHDNQQSGKWVDGQSIYDYLKSKNILDSCLGLQDGLAIQQQGIAVFRNFFAGNAVFLWRSVVQDRRDLLHVPYLVEDVGGVVVGWLWLAIKSWRDWHPAARWQFAS